MLGLLLLDVLTTSQLCAAFLYSTFYSITTIAALLLGRQVLLAPVYRSEGDTSKR